MAKAPGGEPSDDQPANQSGRLLESPEGTVVIDVPIQLGQQIDVTSSDGKTGFKGTVNTFLKGGMGQKRTEYLVDGQLFYDEGGEQKGSRIYHVMSFTYFGRPEPHGPSKFEFTLNKYPNSSNSIIRVAYQEGREIRFQVIKQPEQPARLDEGRSPAFRI